MRDVSHLPTSFAGAADRQVFVGTARAVASASMIWNKPLGISMVHILAVGQGGNGVAGVVGATAAGGAGGGSGGQSSLIIPAMFLPDQLYISAGAGGAGTAIQTIIAARPCGATFNSIPLAGDTFLWAGGAIGNAVTAGVIGTLAAGILGGRGQTTFLAGLAGGAGGAATPTVGTAAGANTTGLMVTSGGGGGGMSAAATTAGGAGGTTVLKTPHTIAAGGAGGSSGVAGGAGKNGYTALDDMIFTGAAGGGSGFPTATASPGGAGGAGGWGCGGGGGGAAVTGQAAGAAGLGGPGFVIITCW